MSANSRLQATRMKPRAPEPGRSAPSRLMMHWLSVVICMLTWNCAWADAASDKRFEGCRKKLVQAQKLDALYDLDGKLPKEPKVVAGPTFFQMPIDAKEGFVDTVNCFLTAGETGTCVNFDVLHWQTGKSVGRFSSCRFKMK